MTPLAWTSPITTTSDGRHFRGVAGVVEIQHAETIEALREATYVGGNPKRIDKTRRQHFYGALSEMFVRKAIDAPPIYLEDEERKRDERRGDGNVDIEWAGRRIECKHRLYPDPWLYFWAETWRRCRGDTFVVTQSRDDPNPGLVVRALGWTDIGTFLRICGPVPFGKTGTEFGVHHGRLEAMPALLAPTLF